MKHRKSRTKLQKESKLRRAAKRKEERTLIRQEIRLRNLPAKIVEDTARRVRHAQHLKACAAKALAKADRIEANLEKEVS